MKKDEAILKIKEQLKKLMTFAAEEEMPTEEKPTEVEKEYEVIKTEDGREMMKEKGTELKKGDILMEKTETGMVKCAKGKYKMEGGIEIEIGEEGEVEEISNPENNPASEAEPMEEAKVEMVEEAPAPEMEKEHNDMKARVDAIEGQISQILEILQGLSNSTEVAMSKIKEFGALPDGEPVKTEVALKSTTKVSGSLRDEITALNEIKKKYKINANAYGFSAASAPNK